MLLTSGLMFRETRLSSLIVYGLISVVACARNCKPHTRGVGTQFCQSVRGRGHTKLVSLSNLSPPWSVEFPLHPLTYC